MFLFPILHNPVSCGADGLLGDAHDAADVAVVQTPHSRVNSPIPAVAPTRCLSRSLS